MSILFDTDRIPIEGNLLRLYRMKQSHHVGILRPSLHPRPDGYFLRIRTPDDAVSAILNYYFGQPTVIGE